jgi:hypothetical protein
MTTMDVQLNIPTEHSHTEFPPSDRDYSLQSHVTLKNTVRKEMLHYRQLYSDLPDPIMFMSFVVNCHFFTLYDDFLCFLFILTTITTLGKVILPFFKNS